MPHIVCNRKQQGLSQWENRNDGLICKPSSNVAEAGSAYVRGNRQAGGTPHVRQYPLFTLRNGSGILLIIGS